ncbi:MAG: hypothetical protein JXL84_15740 [Deltaproteobacteria bacterium]|nr:hypothetical protein [Deltaproteobacteria bacterium]
MVSGWIPIHPRDREKAIGTLAGGMARSGEEAVEHLKNRPWTCWSWI